MNEIGNSNGKAMYTKLIFLVKINKINKTLQNLITAKDRTKKNMNGKGDKF